LSLQIKNNLPHLKSDLSKKLFLSQSQKFSLN